MADSTTVVIKGGPATPKREWTQVTKAVAAMAEAVFAEAGIVGEIALYAMQARAGGSHHKGFNFARLDDDAHRPNVFFVSQPFDNKSCWVYRWTVPRGTDDVRVIAERLRTACVSFNGVRSSIPKPPSAEPHKTEDVSEGDMAWDPVSALIADDLQVASVLEHIRVAMIQYSGEDACSIANADAHAALQDGLGAMCSPKVIGQITSELVRTQHLGLDREKGLMYFAEKGRELFQRIGTDVKVYKNGAAPAHVPEASPRAIEPPRSVKSVADADDYTEALRRIRALLDDKTIRTLVVMIGQIGHWSKQDPPSLRRVHALNVVDGYFEKKYDRRDVGRIVQTLIERGYFQHNREFDDLVYTEKGRAVVSQKEALVTATATAPPSHVSLEESVRELKARARRYEEARAAMESSGRSIGEIEQSIAEIERTLAQKKEELERLRAEVNAAREILSDESHRQAAEELDRIKKLFDA